MCTGEGLSRGDRQNCQDCLDNAGVRRRPFLSRLVQPETIEGHADTAAPWRVVELET